MLALRDRDIDIAEPRARDEQGRLVQEYIPGSLAMEREPLDAELLRRIGALVVRAIHEASVGLKVPDTWDVLIPAQRPDLLCHSDLAESDGATRTRNAQPSSALTRVRPPTLGVHVRAGTRRPLGRDRHVHRPTHATLATCDCLLTA